jgi:hypothetical protein
MKFHYEFAQTQRGTIVTVVCQNAKGEVLGVSTSFIAGEHINEKDFAKKAAKEAK